MTWRAHALALALAPMVWPATARAHGAAPAVTGVLAATAAGPTVLAVTEGLLQLRGDDWRFICPVQFGSEPAPPGASSDGARTFVVGSEDLFVLEPDGTVAALGRPELSRRTVLRFVDASGTLLALRFAGGSTELVRVDATSTTRLWGALAAYDSLSVESATVWIGRADAGAGHAVRVGVDGAVLDERAFATSDGDRVTGVQSVQGTVHVALSTRTLGGRLIRLETDGGVSTVLDRPATFSGPVATSSGTKGWVTSTGALYALLDGGAAVVAPDVTATGVVAIGATSYVLARDELLSLDENGPGDALFRLEDVVAPELARVPVELRDRCESEWLVFRSDLVGAGLIRGTPPADASVATPLQAHGASGGCTLARGMAARQPSWVTWQIACCLVTLARVRRRAHRDGLPPPLRAPRGPAMRSPRRRTSRGRSTGT